MNLKKLKTYKVMLEDGSVENVVGFWAAHAWFIAEQLFPGKKIQDLKLESSDNETHETWTPVA